MANDIEYPCPCCGTTEEPAWVETDYDQFQYFCECGLSTPIENTKIASFNWWIFLSELKG